MPERYWKEHKETIEQENRDLDQATYNRQLERRLRGISAPPESELYERLSDPRLPTCLEKECLDPRNIEPHVCAKALLQKPKGVMILSPGTYCMECECPGKAQRYIEKRIISKPWPQWPDDIKED